MNEALDIINEIGHGAWFVLGCYLFYILARTFIAELRDPMGFLAGFAAWRLRRDMGEQMVFAMLLLLLGGLVRAGYIWVGVLSEHPAKLTRALESNVLTVSLVFLVLGTVWCVRTLEPRHKFWLVFTMGILIPVAVGIAVRSLQALL